MTPHSVNDFAQHFVPLYFNELVCFGQFCKHALFGSHSAGEGPHLVPISLKFGPHRVPILKKVGPHANWEQCNSSLLAASSKSSNVSTYMRITILFFLETVQCTVCILQWFDCWNCCLLAKITSKKVLRQLIDL